VTNAHRCPRCRQIAPPAFHPSRQPYCVRCLQRMSGRNRRLARTVFWPALVMLVAAPFAAEVTLGVVLAAGGLGGMLAAWLTDRDILAP